MIGKMPNFVETGERGQKLVKFCKFSIQKPIENYFMLTGTAS